MKLVALVVILLNYIQLSIIKILIDYCLEGKAYEIIFKSLHSCIRIIITAKYGQCGEKMIVTIMFLAMLGRC